MSDQKFLINKIDIIEYKKEESPHYDWFLFKDITDVPKKVVEYLNENWDAEYELGYKIYRRKWNVNTVKYEVTDSREPFYEKTHAEYVNYITSLDTRVPINLHNLELRKQIDDYYKIDYEIIKDKITIYLVYTIPGSYEIDRKKFKIVVISIKGTEGQEIKLICDHCDSILYR